MFNIIYKNMRIVYQLCCCVTYLDRTCLL